VLDLMRMDPATVRRRWSVVLERTVRELQGLSCIALEEQPTPKKEIACTRSFGRPVTDLGPLIEAVSEFAARAAEKLRGQASVASEVLVFAHTSPHRPGPRFSQSTNVPLRRPTSDTAALVQAAVLGLRSIYQPGFQLIKAGVMLLDLVPGSLYQGELDLEPETTGERAKLMATIDTLNTKYGKGMVRLASSGIDDRTRQWGMRQERLTPGYTTAWADMPIAKAV
jgi:DNA polymerase V